MALRDLRASTTPLSANYPALQQDPTALDEGRPVFAPTIAIDDEAGIIYAGKKAINTPGAGGSGAILQNSITPSAADMQGFSSFDLVAGVPGKLVIPTAIAVQCQCAQGNRYSTSGNFLIQIFDGTQIGSVDSSVFAQEGTNNFSQSQIIINPINTIDSALGNPLLLVSNGQDLNGGIPNTPLTVGVGGVGYAPGDTGTWGAFNAFTYTVLTVSGGAVVTFSVDIAQNDWAYAGNQSTFVSTGGGNGAFQIHVPSVQKGDAPVRITTSYYLLDGTF